MPDNELHLNDIPVQPEPDMPTAPDAVEPSTFASHSTSKNELPLKFDSSLCAGFFPRLAAFAVDSLIASIPGALLLISRIVLSLSGSAFFSTNIFFSWSAADITKYILYAAYFVLMTGLTGTTVGKGLMGLRVVSSDGEALSWLDVLYRETVGRYLSSVFFLGYMVLAFDKQHRGFHDMLCDTRVVFSHRENDERQTLPSL